MKHLGEITIYSRPVYLERVSDFSALAHVELPSKHTVLLLVADASATKAEVIYTAASRLVDRGVTYACAWGSDCERIHDVFDEVDVGAVSGDPDDFIMTTWHSDESLDEAVDFFLACAFPLDQHLDTCSWIAIIVGDATPASLVEDAIHRGISPTETTETQNNGRQATASPPPAT